MVRHGRKSDSAFPQTPSYTSTSTSVHMRRNLASGLAGHSGDESVDKTPPRKKG